MKRLITLLTVVLFATAVSAQVGRFSMKVAAGGGAESGYTDEYDALLAAWDVDPTGDTLDWQDSLIIRLDTAGVTLYGKSLWDKGNVIYLCAQVNEQAATINWKSPGDYTITDPESTDPYFELNQGWRGNGSSDYLAMNWNPKDDGSANVNRDSLTLSVYCMDTISSGTSSGTLFGAEEADSLTHILPHLSGGQLFARINSNIAYLHTDQNISYGMFTFVKRNSTQISGYTNGVLDQNRTAASIGECGTDFAILANNDDGVMDSFSPNQVGFIYIGEQLSDTEVAYLNTIVDWYMGKIGQSKQ